MSIFPTSREDRWSLVLTALGAYILGVPLVGMCSKLLAAFLGWDDLDRASYRAQTVLQAEEAKRYSVLGFVYLLCLVALFLLLPALRDKRARHGAPAIWTFGLVLLVILIYPMTQVPKTK